VSHYLGVPVLRHESPKPSYACIKGIRTYFASLRETSQSLPALLSSSSSFETEATGVQDGTRERKSDFRPPQDSELIIVGDRIFTDVVLANRMRSRRPSTSLESSTAGPLAIWTTHVWEKESMLMRWAEGTLSRAMEAWTKPRSTSSIKAISGQRNGNQNQNAQDIDVRRFVKNDEVERSAKKSLRGMETRWYYQVGLGENQNAITSSFRQT
jgi:hypothetical protein